MIIYLNIFFNVFFWFLRTFIIVGFYLHLRTLVSEYEITCCIVVNTARAIYASINAIYYASKDISIYFLFYGLALKFEWIRRKNMIVKQKKKISSKVFCPKRTLICRGTPLPSAIYVSMHKGYTLNRNQIRKHNRF